MSEHELKVRVYYADTDAEGIVYYANYLRFAEYARTEMMRDDGFEHAQLFHESGMGLVVASVNINYKSSAKLDDLLTVKSKVTKLGGASMKMQQNVYRDDELLTEIDVTLVCVDKSLKAVRLPKKVREIFKL